MNCYEHVFITKGDLTENQSKKIIGKYEDIINKNSGKVIKTEEWGLRNLAYKIKNVKKGFYFHFKFEGVAKTIEELERTENIDEMLIRFLTVKVKKHDLETNYFSKKESDKKVD
tara:strand:- start:75 stop:416 length:342 start_codon:yes stop_codon:yes gene_type:complete